MSDVPIGFCLGREACTSCGKIVFWNEDMPETRPRRCPFCGTGLPLNDAEKIDKLLAKHYQLMATKNIWYNPPWQKACTKLCVMASDFRAKGKQRRHILSLTRLQIIYCVRMEAEVFVPNADVEINLLSTACTVWKTYLKKK